MAQPVGFCINPVYCPPTHTTLVLKEKTSFSGDDFTAHDSEGRLWFKMDSKTFSLRDKRQLLDAHGQVVCTLTKKLTSLHGSWIMYRGASTDNSQKLVLIEPKIVTLKPMVRIFLQDGDKDPDFLIKGNFLAKKFDIFQVQSGQERLVAQCHKQSKFESMSAFLKSQISDRQTYYLEVQPGIDAAFVVALSVCVDEIYRDQQQS